LAALLSALLAPLCLAAENPRGAVPEEWRTPAERADYRSTPDLASTVAYLERLADASPLVHLDTFGTSAAGRAMPLVVVSAHGVTDPAGARGTGLPVVMIQNGIHAGEIDGKDACLALLRDLVTDRRPALRAALEGLAAVVVVPVYNVDGHERVSPFNRPNQNGPVDGMGFRTTAAHRDLNRDHTRLDTVEARSLIDLFVRWRPHLHVDDHVTDGSDHDWTLTWFWAEAPQLAAPLDAWMDAHFPAAVGAVEEAGYRAGPYVSLLDGSDPSKGFSSWVADPRYSSGYFPLRHRPSILVEMHSYKPYRARVLALEAFLAGLLEETARGGRELVAAVAAAEQAEIEAGLAVGDPDGDPDGEAPPVVVDWDGEDTGDTVRWPVYAWEMDDSRALGVPLLHYRRGEIAGGAREGLEVPWIHRPTAVATRPRPRGYLLLPGWNEIASRLEAHGLRVERIDRAFEVSAEVTRLSEPTFAAQPYQGRHRLDEVTVSRTTETVQVPPGALWVGADQADFPLVVALLEPDAPDSLLRWGVVSSLFERNEYIEPRVLEPLVREMLELEEHRAAWEAAVAADPELEGNPGARWMWWYQRTPYWDAHVGRYPVLRLDTVPAPLAD
jgi:hypothetical protein